MNKKIVSGILSAVMLISTAALAADFDAGEKYQEQENAAAKTQTQSLYDNRPATLRQAEDLGRGLVAVPAKDGGVLVSWRYLGTDSRGESFTLLKNGEKIAEVTDSTNYVDKDGKAGDEYTLTTDSEKTTVKAWDKEYISIPVKKYDKGNYIVDDASVGDLDGDGEYEIVVRRTPDGFFDLMQVDEGGKVIDTREAYPLIEAYEMDGTHMWTLDIGKNEANEIDVNFLVYDLDGDGKAEVVMRSYDGMTDGKGNKIGVADADWTYSLQKQKDRQYLSEGNEYLSVFDGQTGAEKARTELLPKRDPLSSWASRYPDVSRLTKRASHFLLSTAYLNGETPSVIMLRGAWDGVKLAAWDYKDGKFTELWQYDSGDTTAADNIYGAGYHSMAVADIDFDGKDEILSGAAAIDDDGKFMYATSANGAKLGHGDAFDVAKMSPDYDGYYIWACHEEKNLPANIDLHDARTGQVIYGFTKPKDTGRSRAADIDPTSEGWEVWGSTGTQLMSFDGSALVESWNSFKYRNPDGSYVKDGETGSDMEATLPMNFKAFWDGDLLSELVDGTTISKYNWNDKCVDILYEATGCAANNGTKAVPCLVADILGDWREEIIWRDEANTELRIYATPYSTEYKIPCLMHDITYREAVAWQNNHYNQPTNTSFYMGAETYEAPAPEIKTTSGKVNPDLNSADVNHLSLPISKSVSTLPFTDIDHVEWAKESIAKMYNAGVISGMTDVTFAPDSKVTKGQFASLITRALNLDIADIDGHWAQKYVDAAKAAGLIDENIAYDTNDFDTPINREEMAAIVAAAAKSENVAVNGEVKVFDDNASVSEWAKPYVDSAVMLGIISGFEDNTFRPAESATRAQAAVMLAKLYGLIK